MSKKNARESVQSDAAPAATSVVSGHAAVAPRAHPENDSDAPSKAPGSALSTAQWVMVGVALAIGVVFRWMYLGERPIHHDESLHAMYGRYFFDFPNEHYYKYDPMLHGPMLYNMMRLVFASFGSTDFAARSPIAIIGTIFTLLPFLFRRYFTPNAFVGLVTFIALSPTLTYWSRFLREDFLVMSSLLICLYAVTVADTRRRWFYFMIGFAVHYCIKASIFVHLALLFGFFAYEFMLVEMIRGERVSYIRAAFGNLMKNQWAFVLGFSVGTIIFWYLYTAGGRYPKGMGEGLFRGFTYWMDQHSKERIEGPFLFHFYQLSWYEFPFMIAFFTHLVMLYREAIPTIRRIAYATPVLIVTAIAIHAWSPDWAPIRFFWSFFRLKNNLDPIGVFVLTIHAFLVTTHHILRRERVLSVAGYFFTALFFSYSYLGEKVPWLSLYPFVAGIIYFALYFQDYFRRNPFPESKNLPVERLLTWSGVTCMVLGLVFILEDATKGRSLPPMSQLFDPFSLPTNIFAAFGPISSALPENQGFLLAGVLLALVGWLGPHLQVCGRVDLAKFFFIAVAVWSLRASVQTNFVFAGKENEFISQVHTTPELKQWAMKVRGEIQGDVAPFRPTVLVTGDPVWPLTWYFRDLPEYKFDSQQKERFKYIFETFEENKAAPAEFDVRKITLRGWWVPDYSQMTLKNFLNYALNHAPWNSSGFTYTTLLVKKSSPVPVTTAP